MHTKEIMEFVAERRTTTYFKNEAILAVCAAYRVLEYLRPDPYFTKPQYPLDPLVQDLISERKFAEAADEIWEEVQRLRVEELGCSSGTEHLKKCMVELISKLVGEDQAAEDRKRVE